MRSSPTSSSYDTHDKRGTHLLDLDAIGKIIDMPRIGYVRVFTPTALRMSDGSVKIVNIYKDVPKAPRKEG